MLGKISAIGALVAFATWVKMVVDLIDPKFLFLVLGRGTGKTEDILAERSMRVIKDMPGAYMAFIASTYEDARKNVLSGLVKGWERKGWVNGVHFVIGLQPPEDWDKPYKTPMTYKNTITFWNGVHMVIGSLDQPTSLAGNSYQHLFGDEARNLNYDKLKNLVPALRGEYLEFCDSVYYLGWSFTTDMPDVLNKDYDWILDREKDMNRNQAELALQAALKVNEIKIEIKKAIDRGNNAAAVKAQKRLKTWEYLHTRARWDLTFYYVASSYVNADLLSEKYYEDALKALGTNFDKSILSLRPKIESGELFYPMLGDHHFIDEAIKPNFYADVEILEDLNTNWKESILVDGSMHLEAGVDFGNQMSMIIGQHLGNYYYLSKEFWTLDPENIDDLGKEFCRFYHDYPTKVIHIYYDRSGNQNRRTKADWATWLKKSIEKDSEGNWMGWQVVLMSRDQATIGQDEEHLFMKRFQGEYSKKLPLLRIAKHQCQNFVSSCQSAKTEMKKTKDGTNYIGKDKRNEKTLKGMNLVRYSTNFSDAGKYLFCRPSWQTVLNSREFVLSDPSVIGS
jgi:hypothetical protein